MKRTLQALTAIAVIAAFNYSDASSAGAATNLTAAWYGPQNAANGSPTTFISPADSISVASSNTQQVVFNVLRPGCTLHSGSCDNTEIIFGAPTGQTLTAGTTYDAITGFLGPFPSFSIETRSGPFPTGTFIVDEATFDGGGIVQTFSARFIAHNPYLGNDFAGQISYHGTAAYHVISTNFGVLDLGSASIGSQIQGTITISNEGPDTDFIDPTFLIDGAPTANGFSIVSNNCAGTLLIMGASCQVVVRFDAVSAGIKTSTLTFTDDVRFSSSWPYKVSLTATALNPLVFVSPGVIDFGTSRVNLFSDIKTITVSAALGGGALSVQDAELIGDDVDEFDFNPASSCFSVTVQPGLSCTIEVVFFPAATGPRSAVLRLNTNDGLYPMVTLRGQGTAGYHIVSASGAGFDYGDAAESEQLPGLNRPIVGAAATPDGDGMWPVATDGGVFTDGNAPFLGSAGNIRLNKPIVGMASTPTGEGYWLVASDGGIFSYGDASFYGSTGNIRLNQPIVGMASTPTGEGYWLVATDGGIFAYGDATFSGSTGAIKLNKPVVGMAASPSGEGYWLVASDGGIFSYGDLEFFGSTGAMKLNRAIVGMSPSPSGAGYWLLASDGGLFAFGDAPFFGSAGNRGVGDVVAMVGTAPTY